MRVESDRSILCGALLSLPCLPLFVINIYSCPLGYELALHSGYQKSRSHMKVLFINMQQQRPVIYEYSLLNYSDVVMCV